MSHIQSENRDATLAQSENEAAAPEDGVSVPIRRRRHTPVAPSKTNILLVIGLVMAVVGIVAVVMTTMKEAAIYAKPVDQLLGQKMLFAAGSGHNARPVNVEGNLVHGTLEKRDVPCEYRFKMEKNGQQLSVRYPQCVVPDMFRDVPGMDVPVTVTGELQADGTFEATNVLAKCPSKYEMERSAARGETMPHSLQTNPAM